MIYYVAMNGSDQNAGTQKEPFATIERARDVIREDIHTGLTEPITVRIAAGNYSVKSLLFDERDSGTADYPIVYEAEGDVVLNGGTVLSADIFEPLTAAEKARLHDDARECVVRADLKKLGLSRADYGEMCVTGSHHAGDRYDDVLLSPIWCELFVNDVRQTIARYPNEGFLYTTDPIREGDGLESSITGKIVYSYTREEWAKKRNPISDIYGIKAEDAARAASWQTLRDVWMFGYPRWNWADMSTPIVCVDAEKCSMETKIVSLYGMKSGAPYYFYNVFEELDSPGEWYLDRDTGVLYLYPNTPLAEAEIGLSLLSDSIIRMENVSYLTLRGITFTGTRADALTISGDHLSVEHCLVKNVAGNAMAITGTHIRVSDCEICHMGKGGILITGGDRATLSSSHNVVENNHIHHIAEIVRTYQPGVSLGGVGAVCRNNRIHDSAHMAIYFIGNDHLIEYNDISHVCKEADDSSAIYSGRDYSTQGTVIRYNYFHDINSAAKKHVGVFAVYCDDNLGKCTIVQNIFVRCQSALLLHGGHNMTFRGNIILDAPANAKSSLVFSKYQCWQDLLGDSTHAKRLREVPWQGEIWRKAYPQIEKYLSWDIETEQRYPHWCDLSGNVIIGHKEFEINFEWNDPRFENKIEDNIIWESSPETDIARLCMEYLPKYIEGFAPIPYDKMGLMKK